MLERLFPLHFSHREDLRRVLVTLAFMALTLIGLMAIVWSQPALPGLRGIAGYVPLHTMLETVSIVVSGLIFSVVWNAPRARMRSNMLLLACAFFGVALLDFSHVLSFQGMPDYVTPASAEKAIAFWLAARLLAATALLLTVVARRRQVDGRLSRYLAFAGIMAMVLIVHWIVLFHPDSLPRTFIPGQGLTAFKRGAEYFLVCLNLVAILILLRRMRKALSFNAPSLLGAIAAMAMSEMMFTLYADVTDVFNLAGHACKIVSYLFLYKAVFVDAIARPYRKLAASQLRLTESKNSLAITLQSIGDAVIATDAAGLVTRMNPTAERLTGWVRAQAIGRPLKEIFNIINAESRIVCPNPVQRVMAHGEIVALANHTALIARDGREYQIADSAAPIRNAQDQIVGVVLVFSDVTEKYNSAARLQASEQRFRDLVESTDGIVWEADARTFSFLSVSNNAIRMLGFSLEDWLLPGFWASRILPEDRDYAVNFCASCTGRLEDHDFEYRFVAQDGRVVWLRDIVRVVSEDGKPRWLRGLMLDITEQKRAQEILQTTLQEKTSLLNEVHHRVKNNLQVITSLLRLESRRSKGSGTQNILTDMQGRIRSMALLHESLYRSGIFASADLGAYLKELATQAFRAQMRNDKVMLRLDLESVRVSMDQATPCGLMVNEIFSNSLKHAFPDGLGGEVRVSLHALEGTEQVRIRVSDSGIGLPDDIEERSTHSLGLQLVADLAHQIGGQLVINEGQANRADNATRQTVFDVIFTPVMAPQTTVSKT